MRGREARRSPMRELETWKISLRAMGWMAIIQWSTVYAATGYAATGYAATVYAATVYAADAARMPSWAARRP